MLYGVIIAVVVIGGAVAAWLAMSKKKQEPAKPKRPLSIDEMTEHQLDEYLTELEDDVISVDGELNAATSELRLRGTALEKAKQDIVTVNTTQKGNEEALQAAVEAYNIAEDEYLAQLEVLKGDEKGRDPGLKARVVEVHANFSKAQLQIKSRTKEFGAARVASINAKLQRTNANITMQNTALEVTEDTTATKALEVRVAAEREAEIMRGGNPRAEKYRTAARSKTVLKDLGIRS